MGEDNSTPASLIQPHKQPEIPFAVCIWAPDQPDSPPVRVGCPPRSCSMARRDGTGPQTCSSVPGEHDLARPDTQRRCLRFPEPGSESLGEVAAHGEEGREGRKKQAGQPGRSLAPSLSMSLPPPPPCPGPQDGGAEAGPGRPHDPFGLLPGRPAEAGRGRERQQRARSASWPRGQQANGEARGRLLPQGPHTKWPAPVPASFRRKTEKERARPGSESPRISLPLTIPTLLEPGGE